MKRGEEKIWGIWRTLKVEIESIYGTWRWRRNLSKGLRITLRFKDRNWTVCRTVRKCSSLYESQYQKHSNRKKPKNCNDNGPLGSTETRNLWNSRATVSFLRRLFSVEFAIKLVLGQVLFLYNKTFDFLLAIIIPPVFNILIRHRSGGMWQTHFHKLRSHLGRDLWPGTWLYSMVGIISNFFFIVFSA